MIQQAINKVIGTTGALLSLQTMANKRVEDIKTAKLKQKAQVEKYRATYQKSRLAKMQAQQKIKEMKQGKDNTVVTLPNGEKLKLPDRYKEILKGNK